MRFDEFQRAYHEYQTLDRKAAQREAASITLEDGSHPAVVALPFRLGIRYCLVLPSVARTLGGLFEEVQLDA